MAFHLGGAGCGGSGGGAAFEVAANDVRVLYERLSLVVGDFRLDDE